MELMSNAIGAVKSKLGLYIAYFVLACALALGIAAIWLYKQNTKLNVQVGSLQAVVDARGEVIDQLHAHNKVQDTTIDNLQTLRDTDSKVVGDLVKDLAALHGSDRVTRKKISELEKQSEEVKSFLDMPVPAAMRNIRSVQQLVAPASAASSGDDHKD